MQLHSLGPNLLLMLVACSSAPSPGEPDAGTADDAATDDAATDDSAIADSLVDCVTDGNGACVTCDVRVPEDHATVAAAVQASPQPGIVCIDAGTYPGDVVLRSLVALQGAGRQTRITGHLLAGSLERSDDLTTFVRDLTVEADRVAVSVCPPSEPDCLSSSVTLDGGTIALALERVTIDGHLPNSLHCAHIEVNGGSLSLAFRDSTCIDQRGIRFRGDFGTAAARFTLDVARSRFEPTTSLGWIYDPVEFLLTAGASCGAQAVPAGSLAKATIVNNEFLRTLYEGIYLTPCLTMDPVDAAASEMRVVHNTFVPAAGGTGEPANAVWYNSVAGFGPHFVYANNLYVGAATNPVRGVQPDAVASNIATAQSLFVDLAAGNLELAAGAPAIDAAAIAYSLATDKTGKSRPLDGNSDGQSLPDVGAHEYGQAAQ